jgi:2-dehydropantoate 2-reductase
MKICIYGAGAIGGTLGARLALSGHQVSLVARGAHLAAIRARGLTFLQGDERHVIALPASDDAADLGPQDAVIVALKAHGLAAGAAGIVPLLGPDTCVVTAMNGVPWWFFEGWGGALAGTRLAACDPDGRIAAAIPAARVVGGVVFPSAAVPEPGVVRLSSGSKVVVGELDGTRSARAQALADAFADAGFESVLSPDIRKDVWLKLWGNVCYNPVSVLTGSHTDDMLDDPLLHEMFTRMMSEAVAVGRALGFDITTPVPERIAQTRRLGHIRTSMLQDAEAGRPIELDGIVGATVEIAEKLGVDAPFIRAVMGMTRRRATQMGLYGAPRA